MAQNEQSKKPHNTWSRTASLLISEASGSETAASRQAVRRLFGPWEQQLLESPRRQAETRPLATLLCLRELLTRFYRVRYEFDKASPPPGVLPIKMTESPDFSSLHDSDGDYGVSLISPLPSRWISAAKKKFVVQQRHCRELDQLFQRYFDADMVRNAIEQQSSSLRSIESNLGYDSAVKAFRNDALRKTLTPLAAKKALDSDAFREMLAQQRKNYDNLTIDGGHHSFAVEGCSFRHTHFRNISLELEGCALHHASFGDDTVLRLVHDCEFGKQAKSLTIDCLRGNYANTHFDQLTTKIIYPGCQLGHVSNSEIAEFGGNVKHLDHCRVDTLRGICLRVSDSHIERAMRARFGTKIEGLRCAEMVDCQFGSRVIEGILSIHSLRGASSSDLTFVHTAFGTIHSDAVLFRLRDCLVKDLRGTIATLERCQVAEVQAGAQINKVIASTIARMSGGVLKLCGTHEECPNKPAEPATHSNRDCSEIAAMTGGLIEHLNGLVKHLRDGDIKRLGFEKGLRLNTVRNYIGEWRGGTIGGMKKAAFLTREKETLRQETLEVGRAIRKRAAVSRNGKPSNTDATTPAPVAAKPIPPEGARVETDAKGYKTIDIDQVAKY